MECLKKDPHTFRQAPTRNVEAVIRRGREEMGSAPTANAAAAAAAAVAAAEAQQQSQQSHCKCIMSRCLKVRLFVRSESMDRFAYHDLFSVACYISSHEFFGFASASLFSCRNTVIASAVATIVSESVFASTATM